MILSGRDVNTRNGDRFHDTQGFVSFSLRAGKERRTKVLGLGRHNYLSGSCGTCPSRVLLESFGFLCMLIEPLHSSVVYLWLCSGLVIETPSRIRLWCHQGLKP